MTEPPVKRDNEYLRTIARMWADFYHVRKEPPYVHSVQMLRLPAGVYGETHYSTLSRREMEPGDDALWVTYPIAYIHIAEFFPETGVITKALLWHEFCHAYLFYRDGKKHYHDEEFEEMLAERPVLKFLDGWPLQLMAPIYRWRFNRRALRLNTTHS